MHCVEAEKGTKRMRHAVMRKTGRDSGDSGDGAIAMMEE
jgi:hypothetical protein